MTTACPQVSSAPSPSKKQSSSQTETSQKSPSKARTTGRHHGIGPAKPNANDLLQNLGGASSSGQDDSPLEDCSGETFRGMHRLSKKIHSSSLEDIADDAAKLEFRLAKGRRRKKKKRNSTTTLLSWNLNGFRTRLENYKLFLSRFSPSVVFLQETHLLPQHPLIVRI